jgi:hypothetical protein
VSRILRRAGVEKNAPGDAHRGKQWSAARRAHHPAKPLRDPNEPSGYAILTARAMRRRVINKAGYVVVHVGKGRKQYEHKIVAERALGRVLRPGEVVHHINCDRSDNRPENLLVCKIAYHLKLHARMRAHPYWKQFNP